MRAVLAASVFVLLGASLSGCAVYEVGSTVVGVGATVVSTTATVVGAVVTAPFPSSDDDKKKN